MNEMTTSDIIKKYEQMNKVAPLTREQMIERNCELNAARKAEMASKTATKPAPRPVSRPQTRRPVYTASGWTEDEEDGIAPNPAAVAKRNIETAAAARKAQHGAEMVAFEQRCAEMVRKFSFKCLPSERDGWTLEEIVEWAVNNL